MDLCDKQNNNVSAPTFDETRRTNTSRKAILVRHEENYFEFVNDNEMNIGIAVIDYLM